MNSISIKNKVIHYIDASFPIIYINTFEEMKADEFIFDISESVRREILEWNAARGVTKWSIKENNIVKSHCSDGDYSLEQALQILKEDQELSEKILVIKDPYHYFDNPKIISMLKDISHKVLLGLEATIIIVSPILSIPRELEQYITVIEIGYLEDFEIEEIIKGFVNEYELSDIKQVLLDEMILAFRGLSEYEIKNILALAYANDGAFTKADLKLIYEQKQQVVKKSGILEMIPLKESLDDIGGLENLKKWLKKKATVINNINKAMEFGVDIPKGVLIAGLPGCGKSLNAKAAAKLFDVPLLRLDMGRVLGKYVGESEANMRKAITLAEAISPCVLWIDEIEKAFAGIGENGGGAEVTTRLFGNFLTWMQEKNSSTFVVATANNILKLPPELMRKGRFDEIFYVELPNREERKKIFEIHISKRRKSDLPKIDIVKLVEKTEGYSGADIEGIVRDGIEDTFASGKLELTTECLLDAISNTHSLSEIMKEPLEKMTKEYKERKFKNASN